MRRVVRRLTGRGYHLSPVRFARHLVPTLLFAAATTTASAQGTIAVAGSDSAMNAAIGQAQATIGQFIARLEHPPTSQTDLGLKVRLTDGEQIEHVWLTDVRHQGNRFTGRINNDIEHLHKYHFGDSVAVMLGQVSDWLAVDGGRLIGGYSIRLLRSRMSPAEREAFDRQVQFRVE
jgi:uncharacterized protein YegJ (DUF2314 family)